NIIPVAV
ncbi:hypothetical protein ECEC1850_0424, partial [Escherichia coli EC1850]